MKSYTIIIFCLGVLAGALPLAAMRSAQDVPSAAPMAQEHQASAKSCYIETEDQFYKIPAFDHKAFLQFAKSFSPALLIPPPTRKPKGA